MRELGLNKRASDLRKRRGSRKRSRSAGGKVPIRDAGAAEGEGSGLARAFMLRAKGGSDSPSQASDSGISEDDRREIQNEIEKVSRQNRISTRPHDFIVRPSKKGFVFPLAVNLLALAVTASAVFLLSYLFRQRDIAIASSSSALDTAEGKLLQELKRDSDSKLQEKDKAISDIQSRLVNLDRERNDLAANIDQKVKTREAELRSALQAELDAEKRRLAGQGISASDLQARIKAYEASMTASMNTQIEAARRSAKAEKAAAQAKFDQLKSEYQKNMTDLGAERKRIEDEAKTREDALRASLDAKSKELATQSAAAQAGLERARLELASLQDQKAKAQAQDDRVLGLYSAIRSALRDRRYLDAATSATALSSYLQDPSLSTDPATQNRRDADIFVAETLGTYARSELDRASADSNRLLAQADQIASARDAAAAAQAALKSGDSALAAAKYNEALGKIPEILAAHNYFMDQLQAAEAQRRSRLEDSLAAADRAFASGDQATASLRYAEALGYLPLGDAARASLVSRLGQLAVAASLKDRGAADTRSARAAYSSASASLSGGDWNGAISGFIGLLASYPAADQAPGALRGIATAVDGLQKAAAAQAASAAAATGLAQKRLADAQAAASAGQSAAATEAAGLRADIEALKAQLAEAQATTAQAAGAASPAGDTAALAAKDGDIARLQAEVKRLSDQASQGASEIEKNRVGAVKYDALLASYKRYLESAGSALKQGGQSAALAAQSSLYSFLGDGGMSEAFPGLRDKVAAFQDASQSELMDAFPSDASEIVQQALGFKDKSALKAYYASKRDTYATSGNSLMVNFLDALSKVLK